MLFVLLDDKEMLDEGRQQPKNVVLIRHQNHLICSVVYVFNHKYGFEQDFFFFSGNDITHLLVPHIPGN